MRARANGRGRHARQEARRRWASDGKRVKSTWTNAAKVIKSATKNSRGVMKVKVFYAAYESSPVHIATVEVPHAEDMVACEHAFRLTQNIDDCWSKRDTEDGNGR